MWMDQDDTIYAVQMFSLLNLNQIKKIVKLNFLTLPSYTETSQLICSTNQLTGFYTMAIFAFNKWTDGSENPFTWLILTIKNEYKSVPS